MPDVVKFDVVKRVHERFAGYLNTGQGIGSHQLLLRDLVTIDGVRAIFDDGCGLIRASNTQPALVLRFEATSPERLDVIRATVERELADAKKSLGH